MAYSNQTSGGADESRYGFLPEISIPKPLLPEVEALITGDDWLGSTALGMVGRLTGEGDPSSLELAGRDIPAIVATTVDMRGSATKRQELYKLTLVHRLAGISFRKIGEAVNENSLFDRDIDPDNFNVGFRDSFFDKAADAYDRRAEDKKHQLGKTALLRGYVDTVRRGETAVTWTSLEDLRNRPQPTTGRVAMEQASNRLALSGPKLNLYEHLMTQRNISDEIIGEPELEGVVLGMASDATKAGLFLPFEAQLLADRILGRDMANADQLLALGRKLHAIVEPRIAEVKPQHAYEVKKLEVMKKILGHFIIRGETVSMIEARIGLDKHNLGTKSLYSELYPKHTRLYLATILQRIMHTPAPKKSLQEQLGL